MTLGKNAVPSWNAGKTVRFPISFIVREAQDSGSVHSTSAY